MFDPTLITWLIPTLPLLGAAGIAALGKPMLGKNSHWPCIAAAAGACFFSLLTLLAVAQSGHDHGHDVAHRSYFTWFQSGNVDVQVALRADGLTAIMLVMVTFIGSLIVMFSIGYMAHDPGYPRFFAAVSLFLFFMTGLVLADNFILLYLCWEGVGLCSYLLIGFWFQKASAAAAARKAFLVTRLGDIGLLLGILLLWSQCGSLEYDRVFERAADLPPGVLLTACLLLLVGAAGKSAQFPLHVWLPDAMEGPTPVSALIHAATMVTAGVYLVARCTPLFAASPEAQVVVACVGAVTMLLAALIALTQTDLKRVMAYSTLSQLGYMFLALGCASAHEHLTAFAVAAAIFHLFTHAFFKALLFLASGSVMHSMGDVIDMRRFSGLKEVLPITHWTFLCGAAALAGVPIFFSGFWSKDEILAAVQHMGHHSALYNALFLMAMLTAGLTAFYTFRAYFMTFWGELKVPHEVFTHGHGHDAHGHDTHAHDTNAHVAHDTHHAHAGHAAQAEHANAPQGDPRAAVHDAPPVMAIPLAVLAAGAVLVGILLGPTHLFVHFLEAHWMTTFPPAMQPPAEPHAMNFGLMAASSAIALLGIGLAYVMYVARPALAARAASASTAAYELSRNKFYLDEIYGAFIVAPMVALAHVSRVVDQYLIDGIVDLIGAVPGWLSALFRPIQNGLVQFYALLMALGVAGFVLSILLR